MADDSYHDGRKRPSETLDQPDLISFSPPQQYAGIRHFENHTEPSGNSQPFSIAPLQSSPYPSTQDSNPLSRYAGYMDLPHVSNGPSPTNPSSYTHSWLLEGLETLDMPNPMPPSLQPPRPASDNSIFFNYPVSFAPDRTTMPFPLVGHPDVNHWQRLQYQLPTFESTRAPQMNPSPIPYGPTAYQGLRHFHANTHGFPGPHGWSVPPIPRRPNDPIPNQVAVSGRPMAVPKSRKAKPKPVEPPKEKCVACLEEWKALEIVTLHCGCKYDHRCLEELVKSHCTPLDFPPKCHGTPVRLNVYGTLLSDETVTKYKKVEAERNIKNLFYCSRPTCSESLTEGPRVTLKMHTFRKCPKCDESTCEKCRQPLNRHKIDKTSQRLKCRSEPKELSALRKLGEKERWKQCPSCGHFIEKEDGCDHIECFCGIEFCYKCGGLFNEYDDCKCLTSDSEDETDEEWPNHRSAIDPIGRQLCRHTDAFKVTGNRCHGCLRVPEDLGNMYNCPECDIELCYRCFDEIWVAERGVHLDKTNGKQG